MNLDELLQAWNDLRDAVQGRGTGKPPEVPQRLYDVIGEEYTAFRAWLSKQNALQQMLHNVFGAPDWLERYRSMAGLARHHGVIVKIPAGALPVPETLTELLEHASITEADLKTQQQNAQPNQLLPRALRPTLGSPGFDYGDLAKAVVVGIVSTIVVRVVLKVLR
jgi:hypothetical protein